MNGSQRLQALRHLRQGRPFHSCLVSHQRESRASRLVLIIVPHDAPGLVLGKLESKMGLHTSLTTQVFFENCRVPRANLLGQEGQGFRYTMQVLDGGRIGIAAMALGLGKAALDASLKYAKEREAFGKPIADFQAIQTMIADSAMGLKPRACSSTRLPRLKDQGKKFAIEASMAKLFATEAADHACWKAIQIHGGAGYLTDFPVERYYRDNRLLLIGEGTSEVQRMIIARDLLHES